VPSGRIQALARFATAAKASAIERLPEQRRLATLVAFALTLEATALDDALDLLDILITEIFSNATKAGEKARLRTIKDLDIAASQLGRACRLVLDPLIPDAELRMAIFKAVSAREFGIGARPSRRTGASSGGHVLPRASAELATCSAVSPHASEDHTFWIHASRPTAGRSLEQLAEQDGRPRLGQPRPEIVSRGWRQYVFGQDGGVDRKAYTFCCLDRLRSALRRRDLFVAPSIRYADARIGLLSGSAWEAARSTVCRSLGHSLSAEETITALSRQLDQTYHVAAANLPNNPAARIETVGGQDELVLTGLDKLEEPPSLVRLREAVNARLPRVDLPEILLEIATRTDFASKFTHVSERASRVGDLAISVCAVLIAEACNIGLEPLVRSEVPALRRARLSWVNQNFLRNETLTDANAFLVAAQNHIAPRQLFLPACCLTDECYPACLSEMLPCLVRLASPETVSAPGEAWERRRG